VRRGHIILSGVGLTLIWTGACCVDSQGTAFMAAAGMMIAGALLISSRLLVSYRGHKRRRAEHERQVKRDNLFRNWINCDVRPVLGGRHTVD